MWTALADYATGQLISAVIWNNILGASGNLEELKLHTHDNTNGDGASSIGPLVLADLTDAAAPAAPGAGKTRFFAKTGGYGGLRSGAAGAARNIAETTVDGLDLATHASRHNSGGDDAISVPSVVKEVGYATVATAGQTTTSTTYVDLATAGPSVTMTAELNNKMTCTFTGGDIRNSTVGSYTVVNAQLDSDAVVVANGIYLREFVADYEVTLSNTIQFASLSAASHTVTLKYRVSGNTGTYVANGSRVLSVVRHT